MNGKENEELTWIFDSLIEIAKSLDCVNGIPPSTHVLWLEELPSLKEPAVYAAHVAWGGCSLISYAPK